MKYLRSQVYQLENFFRIAKQQRNSFSERTGGMIFNEISEK